MGRKEELLAQYEARIVNAHNASFAGMTIDGPVFRYAGREYPINSISAEVIVGAQTSKSRSTATRIIGGGLVAGPGGMLLGGAAKKKRIRRRSTSRSSSVMALSTVSPNPQTRRVSYGGLPTS